LELSVISFNPIWLEVLKWPPSKVFGKIEEKNSKMLAIFSSSFKLFFGQKHEKQSFSKS